VPKDVSLPVVIIDKSNVQTFMRTPEERAVPSWDKSIGGKA
jgi:hypothetical protein